jgi:hypothetical protein
MKQLLTALMIMGVTLVAHAQTPKTAAPIKDTVIKGTSYPLYQGAKGGKYIVVTTKDGSHSYKKYFPKPKDGGK